MKKILIMTLLVFVCTACEKSTQKKENEESLAVKKTVETWQYSIKSLNFKLYSQARLYPRGREIFEEEYKDSYYDNLSIMTISASVPKQIDDVDYLSRDVEIAAEIISRESKIQKGMIYGNIEIVRPAQEGTLWQVHNTTLIQRVQAEQ